MIAKPIGRAHRYEIPLPQTRNPLCEGSLWTVLSAKPPLKGEVPAICGRRGLFPHTAKVAAALSAAVTTAKLQETAPNEQGHIVWRKSQLRPQPLFGRRGLGRRGFSQRSRLLPRISPRISSGGGPGEGLLYREAPPPEFPTAPSSLVLSAAMGGRHFLRERRKSCEGAFGRLTRRNRPWDGSASLEPGALDPQRRCCQS